MRFLLALALVLVCSPVAAQAVTDKQFYTRAELEAIRRMTPQYIPPQYSSEELAELDAWVPRIVIGPGGSLTGAIIPPPQDVEKFHQYAMPPAPSDTPLQGIYRDWVVVDRGPGWRYVCVPYDKPKEWYVKHGYVGLEGTVRVVITKLRPWPNPLVNTGDTSVHERMRVMRWWQRVQKQAHSSDRPSGAISPPSKWSPKEYGRYRRYQFH